MNIENVSSVAATAGGGFFVDVLVGYALKKVIKLLSIMAGLFFAGLAYLQYQQVASINWAKLQSVSESTVATLANATTQIPLGVNSGNGEQTITATMTNFGIPLTGSMAMGFTIGFMKG